MIFSKKTCKILSAMLMALIIAISSCPISFAASAAKGTGDSKDDLYYELFETSVLIKTASPYYFKNGKKVYFSNENKAYFPKYNSDEIFVKPDVLTKMLDAVITYSAKDETFTLKKGSTVATLRIGEDAVYVNGEGKFIENYARFNGKVMCLPAVVAAKALGYDVQTSGDVIVLNNNGLLHINTELGVDDMTKSVELEEHFSNLPATADGVPYIRGWSFYDWGSSDGFKMDVGYTTENTAHGYAAYLGATPRSFIGLHQTGTSRIALDKDKYAYKVDFMARKTDDYAANNPIIVVLYYSGDKYVGSDFFKPEGELTDEWNNYSVMIDNSFYKDRDATSFSVVFGTQFDDKSESQPGGYIYYGDAVVTSYSYQSKELLMYLSLLDENFNDYVFGSDFESDDKALGFFDWGSGTRTATTYKTVVDSDASFSGEKYGEIDAVPTSYAGFTSSVINVEPTKHDIVITYFAKKSDDYSANTPFASVNYYKDGRYIRQRGFLPAKENMISADWSKFTFRLPYRDWDDTKWDYNQVTLIVGTSASGVTENNPAGGKLYIDNVKMYLAEPSTGNAEADFSYDDMYSVYELGKSVTYKADNPEQLEPYSDFRAVLYDIDGEIVSEQTKSKSDVAAEGFTFCPEQPGYYETEVTAYTKDGDMYTVASSYTGKKDAYTTADVVSKRRAFVVTRGTAKPMEDRNDFLMLSDNASRADMLHYGNILGYSGVRIHTVNWGSSAAKAGFNPSAGVYDWTIVDSQINNCVNEGFKTIIPNIMYTPKWAVPDEYRNVNNVNIVGAYGHNLYAPANEAVTEDAMKAFVARYGDKIDGIEFYNEPYYGNAQTAFWYDTAEKFVEMSLAAAKAIKSANPNLEFWSAGHLATAAGAQFFDDTMQNEEFKNLVDVVSHHGTYNTTDLFQAYMQKNGITDKKVVNSESYAYAYTTALGSSKDFREANMKYIMHMLYEMKKGLAADCYFCLDEGDATLYSAGISTTNYGIIRTYPYLEPRQGASTAFMFNKSVGKEFKYEGEYDFGDVKGVRFTSDGKPLVIFWNSKDKSFAIPEKLKQAMKDGTTIYDFEGKTVDVDNLKPKKVFYLYDADEAVLNSLEFTPDAALSTDFKLPYYTAESNKVRVPTLDELDESLPRIANSANKPFDEKTFALADDIEWHTDGWKWQSRGGEEAPGHSVRHAIHIDSDGLYMLIDVTDPDHYQKGKTDTVNSLWEGDSIQFGFNSSLATSGSDRMECQMALTDDGVILFKQVSQDIGAMLPTSFTKANQVMPKNYSSITRTSEGLMYKIFIPTSELFTYVYPGPANYIRLSLLVNNTDDDSGSKGYYEWGSGIGGSKSVAPYAIVTLPELEK